MTARLQKHGKSKTKLRRICASAAGFGMAAASLPGIAFAQSAVTTASNSSSLMATLLVGVSGFSVFLAGSYWRHRTERKEMESRSVQQVEILKARLSRVERTLGHSGHLYVIWTGRSPVAEVVGSANLIPELPKNPLHVPKWAWVDPQDQSHIADALELMRATGEGFQCVIKTISGQELAVSGAIQASDTVLCFRSVTAQPAALMSGSAHNGNKSMMDMQDALAQSLAHAIGQDTSAQDAFLMSCTYPAWKRDENGRLSWVNLAYVEAVESTSIERVISNQVELLDEAGRRLMLQDVKKKGRFRGHLTGVAASNRVTFDVSECALGQGSVGMCVNVTPYLASAQDLERQMAAHKRTLENIPLAVAMFGGDKNMIFANAAFQSLWGIEPAFIEEKPSEARFLDYLREHSLLPEQADYKKWKNKHLEIYHSTEVKEDWWHLPQGRTIHVIANPNPAGGMIYFYEDVTQQLSIETQYNHLMRVQHETLEALTEGVAVFGSNGRLKLINPAFMNHWQIAETAVNPDMHADELFALCAKILPSADMWAMLKGHITAFDVQRVAQQGQVETTQGKILDWATLPLPDGGTLLTFMDATASVLMQRGLAERNDALEAAHQLKNDFIQHISYELRSPLTNVIGFAQLLADQNTGKLNKKQGDYLDYILSSSSSLLTIINDILDLATIDAGIMALELEKVDPVAAITHVVEALNPKFTEEEIGLTVKIDEKIGKFEADPRRIQQILTHLISNAIGFSKPGQMVVVEAKRQKDAVIISVQDEGAGISPEDIASVFDRFVSQKNGSKHKGVGLGLSIVKAFVELHKGQISIQSELGKGTKVICAFPVKLNAAEVGSDQAQVA